MRKSLRRIVRAVAAGLIATVPVIAGPCKNVQYPADNTQIRWGVAIARPKVVAMMTDSAQPELAFGEVGGASD